ncbi:stalk domain-containing protein [Paenibacillus sp. GbtcB18]|uniref:stalk domain-containing protein n=1 Tax=Paenibacillus sp. GbtcB18 TaxID=2824763 RepID=UPI001C2F5114|nr:stalk domain-containing protein [Paenibacillus sp. GbtcB18]
MKKSFKLLTLGLAGSCLLAASTGTSYANSAVQAPAATSVAAEPVSAQASVKNGAVQVTTKEIKEDSPELSVNLQLPVIQGMKDTQYQDELNDIIYRHAMKDVEAVRTQAQRDLAAANGSASELAMPYSVDLIAEVSASGGQEDANRLSLRVATSVYTGGAHGMPRVDTYNVLNAEEAQKIELKDLFGDNYKAIIDKQISQEIAKHPDDFFEDAFSGITDTQSFQIRDGKAVIVFSPYDIAPYAAGIQEFSIPIAQGGSSSAPSSLVVGGEVLSAKQGSLYTTAEGTTMVPLRVTAEKLGFQLKWNQEQWAAELSKGAVWTSVYKNKDAYTINKMAPISLGEAAVIKEDGNMYVPASFFSKILKADVTVTGDQLAIK